MNQRYNYNKRELMFLGCFILITILLFFVNLVNAIGVAAPYSGSELPLEMYAGEERIVGLELQNWDIEGDIVFNGTILSGREIASLVDGEVNVPYQVKTPTEMIVKIPKGAKVGDVYNIQYEFKQIGGEGEGMVVFSQGIERNFDVNIIEKPRTDLGKEIGIIWMILGVVLIVILIVIIWFVVKSRRDKKRIEESK
jgi:hypothetical protein